MLLVNAHIFVSVIAAALFMKHLMLIACLVTLEPLELLSIIWRSHWLLSGRRLESESMLLLRWLSPAANYTWKKN